MSRDSSHESGVKIIHNDVERKYLSIYVYTLLSPDFLILYSKVKLIRYAKYITISFNCVIIRLVLCPYRALVRLPTVDIAQEPECSVVNKKHQNRRVAINR